MCPESIQPPTPPEAEAAQAARVAAFERKQKWKEQPGNRYTADELRQMAQNLAPFTLHKRRTKVMRLD